MRCQSLTVKHMYLSKITQICMMALLMAWAKQAKADLIAYTDFEEPWVPSTKYTDTGDYTVNHALVNNAGQPIVNGLRTGPELGFSSSYFKTRSSGSGIQNDSVGVMKEMASHGLQSFTMSDIDGLMTTTLDSVPFGHYRNVTLSLDLYIAATSWEANDHVRVWTSVDSGTQLDLLNVSGQMIENKHLEGRWHQLSIDLGGYTIGTLAFLLDSNANPEKIHIDNVQFHGEPVPLPGSFVLACLGLGFAGWLKKY